VAVHCYDDSTINIVVVIIIIIYILYLRSDSCFTRETFGLICLWLLCVNLAGV